MAEIEPGGSKAMSAAAGRLIRREVAPWQGATASPTWLMLRRLVRNPKGATGTVVLALLILMAVLAPYLAPYDPTEIHLSDKLQAPCTAYWFGADELGRDILSRILYGAMVSLQVGLVAVLLSAAVGVLTGLVAGYFLGWVDAIVMRIWETAMAFPGMFLAIAVVAILGPGRWVAVIAVALTSMPGFARITRALVLTIRRAEYVEAAVAAGSTDGRIIIRTILPNCVAPLIVNMAIAAPGAILMEAGLAYLGLGSQPPQPSWGKMLQTAQSYLWVAPTYGIAPGAAITLVVLGLNFLADGLQDALDPRRTHIAGR